MRYFKKMTFMAALFLVSNGIHAQAGQNLPNYNEALSQQLSKRQAAARTGQQRAVSTQSLREQIAQSPLVSKSTLPQVDSRFGVPSFLMASETLAAIKVGRLAQNIHNKSEFAAKEFLRQFAPLYKLNEKTLSGANVRNVHDTGNGVVIVKFNQKVDGIEVFGHEMNVMMDRDAKLKAISGFLSPYAETPTGGRSTFGTQNGPSGSFKLNAREAIVIAFKNLGGELDASNLTLTKVKGDYAHYKTDSLKEREYNLRDGARAKKVLFGVQDRLVPAYYLEVIGSKLDNPNDRDHYSYVISAENGKVLFRNNLVAHNNTGVEHTYKVYADENGIPYDSPRGNGGTPYLTIDSNKPDFVSQREVTLEYHPSISTKDPWLSPDATITKGNNVAAYVDLGSGDGYQANSTDHYAPVSSILNFDYTYGEADASGEVNSTEYRNAAITNLFYINNFLHNWFYDAGFDEAAGNAQANNYGRGGMEGDVLLAEAQDYSGTDNANMSTPADGASPRMQMYLFLPTGDRLSFYNADDSLNNVLQLQKFKISEFGPTKFNVTAELVRAEDNAGGTEGCNAIDNSRNNVSGKIAVIDRGSCAYTDKVINAQTAGALGVLVVNNASTHADDIFAMKAADAAAGAPVTIPSMLVSNHTGKLIDQETNSGTVIKANMKNEEVTGRAKRDGTFDNMIIAHEWGHYISNRLVGNGNGLGNNQGGSLGEGWGDFHSLLMAVREEDRQIAGNENFQAPYATGAYVLTEQDHQPYYYGIRRYPYSTNMEINPLTFKHIVNGEALPNEPVRNPSKKPNAEVHRSGEIWTLVLWEVYASLLSSDRLSFEQMREQMKIYLVGGYKMTPINPTFTEARDAILSVIKAYSTADYELAKKAFAKRGLGAFAVSPDRNSIDHVGAVESFELTGGSLQYLSASINKSGGFCDSDNTIDAGERFKIAVSLRNSGFQRLENTTATVEVDPSSDTGITVTFGDNEDSKGTINFLASNPNETITGSTTAKLTQAPRAGKLILKITYSDSAIAGDPVTASDKLTEYVHFDVGAPSSLTDDGEKPYSDWVLSNAIKESSAGWSYYTDLSQIPTSAFAHISAGNATTLKALKHGFYAVDSSSTSDMTMTSPEVTVNGNGVLTLSFKHLYHFENGNWDGGVLEVSINGADWKDITEVGAVTPAYDGKFVNNVNPMSQLNGAFRNAWVNTSPDFPALTGATATISNIADAKVKVRFRAGSDGAAGDFGWYIDDITFAGITNTPFTSIADNAGTCINRAPLVDAGADQTAQANAAVTLQGNASDEDGDSMTYQWKQTAGPSVTLVNADQKTATFTTPNVVQNTTLTFAFYAMDGKVASKPDYVNIKVESTNHAPTTPFLVFPENGATGVDSDVTFQWFNATDSDGNNISYELSYCTNAQFTNCKSGNVVTNAGSSALKAGMNGLAVFFLSLIAFGMVMRRNLKGRLNKLFLISIVSIAFTVTACSNSDDDDGEKVKTVTTIQTVTKADTTKANVTGLQSGTTYYWKVKAVDNLGATTESMTYAFTVK